VPFQWYSAAVVWARFPARQGADHEPETATDGGRIRGTAEPPVIRSFWPTAVRRNGQILFVRARFRSP